MTFYTLFNNKNTIIILILGICTILLISYIIYINTKKTEGFTNLTVQQETTKLLNKYEKYMLSTKDLKPKLRILTNKIIRKLKSNNVKINNIQARKKNIYNSLINKSKKRRDKYTQTQKIDMAIESYLNGYELSNEDIFFDIFTEELKLNDFNNRNQLNNAIKNKANKFRNDAINEFQNNTINSYINNKININDPVFEKIGNDKAQQLFRENKINNNNIRNISKNITNNVKKIAISRKVTILAEENNINNKKLNSFIKRHIDNKDNINKRIAKSILNKAESQFKTSQNNNSNTSQNKNTTIQDDESNTSQNENTTIQDDESNTSQNENTTIQDDESNTILQSSDSEEIYRIDDTTNETSTDNNIVFGGESVSEVNVQNVYSGFTYNNDGNMLIYNDNGIVNSIPADILDDTNNNRITLSDNDKLYEFTYDNITAYTKNMNNNDYLIFYSVKNIELTIKKDRVDFTFNDDKTITVCTKETNANNEPLFCTNKITELETLLNTTTTTTMGITTTTMGTTNTKPIQSELSEFAQNSLVHHSGFTYPGFFNNNLVDTVIYYDKFNNKNIVNDQDIRKSNDQVIYNIDNREYIFKLDDLTAYYYTFNDDKKITSLTMLDITNKKYNLSLEDIKLEDNEAIILEDENKLLSVALSNGSIISSGNEINRYLSDKNNNSEDTETIDNGEDTLIFNNISDDITFISEQTSSTQPSEHVAETFINYKNNYNNYSNYSGIRSVNAEGFESELNKKINPLDYVNEKLLTKCYKKCMI